MPMTRYCRLFPRCVPLACLVAACSHEEPPAEAATTPQATVQTTMPAEAESHILWFEGSVDDALMAAVDQSKPIFLYWGAQWCPPCMQLKTTVFNRPDFIATTGLFVPVYLDGDTPGAQRWGEHFGVVGYPTLIVLRADGRELTRISSIIDLEAYPRVLRIAARQTQPMDELIETALAHPEALSEDDWQLLANYSWWDDRAWAGRETSKAQVLAQLAATTPVQGLRDPFQLLQLALMLDAGDASEPQLSEPQQTAAAALLKRLLGSPELLRANIETLNYFAVDIVQACGADAGQRAALGKQLDTAMRQVAVAEDGYTIKDRLYAERTRVALFKALNPDAELPEPLVADVRAVVAWADQAAKTPQERQGMANYATYTLESAGLKGDAEALLSREIERSPDAYYFMPTLADYAQERGDTDQALAWLERAYRESRGPATRAQWGMSYVSGLLEMQPDNIERIEQVTTQIIDELAKEPTAFYQRTQMRLQRLDAGLSQWAQQAPARADTVARLASAMGRVCAQLPESSEANTACRALFHGSAEPTTT